MMRNSTTFFKALAEELDVPESRYEEAVARYKSVGEFLNRDQSALAHYEPDVYPQGSFRLGTAIKPIHSGEEYDIDLVCEVQSDKVSHTQEQLKRLIGDELKLYARKHGMNSSPKDKRRCWTLEYSDDAQFHLDVLPAVPDSVSMRKMLTEGGFEADERTNKSIAITDKEHPHYGVRCDDWNQSNPKGYAAWFESRMKIQLDERRSKIALAINKSVDEVPDYKVKTPLQRAVQILKRHRDMLFQDDAEHKPISVIITTLAALVYDNEASLDLALERIVVGIKSQIKVKNGQPYIANPVNPLENFADKWAEEPIKEKEFYRWIDQLQRDYQNLLQSTDVSANRPLLEQRFGDRTISKIYPKLALVPKIKNSALSLYSSVANVLAVPHRQIPRWRMANLYSVSIQASYSRDGFRDTNIHSDANALPKNGKLRFEARTNFPGPSRIYWQIVNTGIQAEKAKGLRGGFYEGVIERGGKVRTESTLYEGKHWVECFIVREGTCIARSGEFIVNIG